ncbi:MAG: lysylphosphatidylglycerol synthase transmembrane domain-containing protein [Chitinophagaceae bacterium]
MNKKTVLLLIQYAVFFGLGFALIYGQYKQLTPADMADLRASVDQVSQRWWIFIPIAIVGFLSHFFRALRWKLMLESLSIRPSVLNITGAVFIGYITNLLIPRMGEVAKCTVMAKYENEPADKLIGTIVAERAFDMVCLLLICVLTFLVQMDVVTAYLQHLSGQSRG